jgi:hypothetical protein
MEAAIAGVGNGKRGAPLPDRYEYLPGIDLTGVVTGNGLVYVLSVGRMTTNHACDKLTPGFREPLRGHPVHLYGVEEPLRIERCTERHRHQPRISGHTGSPQENFDVPMPEDSGGNVKAVVGGLVGSADQFAEFQDIGDPLRAESNKPVQRGRPGAQRRRTKHEPPLERGLGVAQERHHEPGPAAESPEDGAFAHAGALREPAHGEPVRPTFLDELPRSLEEQLPVAGGVTAFGLSAERRSGPDWDEAHKQYSSPGNNIRTAVRLAWVKAPTASMITQPRDSPEARY